MSYSVDHIRSLLEAIQRKAADVVIASPYMKGGKVTNVPFTRALMSRIVNFYMSITSQDKFFTFTSMVRAYKGTFLRSLNIKSLDYSVNPEILYKSMILRARIEEIPAHLDWTYQNKAGKKRTSGIKIIKGTFSALMSGFIFRPYIFFIGTGFIFLLLALYIISWILINTFQIYPTVSVDTSYFDDQFAAAIAELFTRRPHSFLIGGFVLIVALQFLGIGFLSLQNKRYFEELFHMNTTMYRHGQQMENVIRKSRLEHDHKEHADLKKVNHV